MPIDRFDTGTYQFKNFTIISETTTIGQWTFNNRFVTFVVTLITRLGLNGLKSIRHLKQIKIHFPFLVLFTFTKVSTVH
jgi:hypothetical protein